MLCMCTNTVSCKNFPQDRNPKPFPMLASLLLPCVLNNLSQIIAYYYLTEDSNPCQHFLAFRNSLNIMYNMVEFWILFTYYRTLLMHEGTFVIEWDSL